MFPQLFHLFHCQLEIVTEVNNGSSYFGPIIANNYRSELNLNFPVKKLVAASLTENQSQCGGCHGQCVFHL